MAPRLDPKKLLVRASDHRLAFNADAAAIVLALTLAALIRFNVIHYVGW